MLFRLNFRKKARTVIKTCLNLFWFLGFWFLALVQLSISVLCREFGIPQEHQIYGAECTVASERQLSR